MYSVLSFLSDSPSPQRWSTTTSIRVHTLPPKLHPLNGGLLLPQRWAPPLKGGHIHPNLEGAPPNLSSASSHAALATISCKVIVRILSPLSIAIGVNKYWRNLQF